MNILSIKKLNVSFYQYERGLRRRRMDIIRNLNLNIKKGEIFAIFGASGSGKSLLAEAIFGLLPYNSICEGEIFYKNKILDKERLENIRGKDIFFIPQTIAALNPLLKIGYQARLELDKKDILKQKKIYSDFGLYENVENMYPFELSGGMARKVLVSDALISNASLIVADEPTPGMDYKATQEIIKYFKNMKKEDKTLVLITHDINMALACADRIGIFYDGEIIEVADIKAFENKGTNLKNPYSKMLIKALPENGLNIIKEEEIYNL